MHGWDMGGLRELAIGEGREGWGGERDGRKERDGRERGKCTS